ncbi:MAG TPA: hypothetical protein VFW79_02030 [Cellulomonas sp.]|uniref:hypothetical protein n=1 Tax=Cellulomonas sp. TaxID=40001 RepID=UPI002E349422|nr:hypothetical protein [Cellulomonas sp.]HEX5331399.1 hypothetical protein [Cellulomonas sp.]
MPHHLRARRTVRGRRQAAVGLSVLVALGVGACTTGTEDVPAVRPTATHSATAAPTEAPATAAPAPVVVPAETRAPGGPVTLVPDADPGTTALAASRALYVHAPTVVLAPVDDIAAQLTGASTAVGLGVPLLLTGGTVVGADVAIELDRLGADVVVAVGAAVVPAGVAAVRLAVGAVPSVPTPPTVTPIASWSAAQVVAPGQEVAAVAGLARPAVATLVVQGPDGAAVAPLTADPIVPAPRNGPPWLPHESPRPPRPPAPPVVPTFAPAAAPAGAFVLTDGAPVQLAALATARAAGVSVLVVPGGDPRLFATAVDTLGAVKPSAVLALGSVFGTPELLAARVAAASTGVQLPGGGQLVFPTAPGVLGKRYVALYGTPGTPGLGVLGEQDDAATVARAEATAAEYRPLTPDAVVPTLEIIATVASAGPGADGNYSAERPPAELRPLIDAAGAAGMTVVLDLQPGRTDFLTQAQQYAELLALPHVGLALDPEWRLAPDHVHLRQIGSVGIDEVNATAAWLADFTRERALPQKLFVLHQFAPRMIVGRERLDLGHDELAVVLHVDGQGGQPAKTGTWALLHDGAPAGVRWGWKNFYDEDTPMLDPVQTMAVQPVPDLITYQ